MRELVTTKNALTVFTQGGLDELLAKIKTEVSAEVPDVETATGRKRIASLAHSVARSKTALDNVGKDLVSGWKEKAKKVDAERRRARDFLDDLKAEVRRPLTKWEETEQQRVDAHQHQIGLIFNMALYLDELTSGQIRDRITSLEDISVGPQFEEFACEAAEAKDQTLRTLRAQLIITEDEERKAEAERKRLEEEALAAQRAREEQIAKEAAKRAKREAEEKARLEREEAERKERERILAEQEKRAEAERAALAAESRAREAEELQKREKEDAERRAKEAEEKAKRDAEEAARMERQKIAGENRRKEEERLAREADKNNRKRVNNEAAESIVTELQLDIAVARKLVVAIATGKIKNVRIDY